MPFTLGFLSVTPRIFKRNGKLVARTAWRLLVPTLGLCWREVTVDPQAQAVRIRRRYGWLFAKSWKIPFRKIAAITYGYRNENPQEHWSWGYDSFDVFSVGLRLAGGAEWHFFSFFGDGTFNNQGPWPDWLYWEDFVFDCQGVQEQESRAFVELLSGLIGAPVAPPGA